MRIRTLFRLLLGATVVLLIGLMAVAASSLFANQRFVKDHDLRLRSLRLADELRQSSDDLTRFARTYVVTGDSEYEQFYWDVLAIRNGTKPRPEGYQNIYWDLVAAGVAPPASGKDMEAVPLRELMRELGFSKAELSKLRQAQEQSDELVRTEETAFNAMKGLFDDGTGRFTRRGPPDQALAVQLMHGPAYHSAKARIMKPINDFLNLIKARTTAATEQDLRRNEFALIVILGLITILLALTFVSGRLVFARVCVPIEALQSQTRGVCGDIHRVARLATDIAEGNPSESFTVQTPPVPLDARNEIGQLGRMHNDMLGHLRVAGKAITKITSDLRERTLQLEVANQDAREATQKAEAASQAKSEFLAKMSHELRTPLNGVIGMLELLLCAELAPQQQRHASLAKTSGDVLLHLINDILDLSKIEAGKLELEAVDFDLRDLVESTGVSLASQAHDKGLELVCSVRPDVPSLLRGDAGRLRQVIMNLANNAIKFTERGQVVVRVTQEEMDSQHVTIRCTVDDSGIGIPPDRVDRVFDAFAQADVSTTRKHGGTGLGLTISKQIIDLMGGHIGVVSESGRGSTFWFTVTLEKRPTGGAPEPQVNNDILGLRILVIDDNAAIREILREQLTGVGIVSEAASNGEHALTMLREAVTRGKPFGLAFLDRHMPQMDGEELARTIKADPALKGLVLVLLTSRTDHDLKRLRSLGFANWLAKPVRQSQLLDAIVEATACAATPLARRRGISNGERAASVKPIQAARTAGARILLAEDNEISQEAAVELLRRAGYQCHAVANGQQAVEAALDKAHDLILMDCQMPEMDGFDATRAIRAHEAEHGPLGKNGKPLPIVALTANAIKGDRERCLAAGMDDCVSKPFNIRVLVVIIEEQLAGAKQNATSEEAPDSRPGHSGNDPTVDSEVPPFDVDGLLKRWGNDKAFAYKLIAKFCARLSADLQKLQQALTAGDVEQATRLAHSLKGAGGYVSAEQFRAVAADLEAECRTGRTDGARQRFERLKAEASRCLSAAPACSEAGACGSKSETLAGSAGVDGLTGGPEQ